MKADTPRGVCLLVGLSFPQSISSYIYSEWLPSSSAAPASARDSSRRYFFTSVLAFLHHYSPWLHVGVLVKHRLLGISTRYPHHDKRKLFLPGAYFCWSSFTSIAMTGGEAALLPRHCTIPHDCFSITVRGEAISWVLSFAYTQKLAKTA